MRSGDGLGQSICKHILGVLLLDVDLLCHCSLTNEVVLDVHMLHALVVDRGVGEADGAGVVLVDGRR